MKARFFLFVAIAGCATAQTASTGTPAGKPPTSQYCNPCKQPCLSTDPCGAAADPCAPGRAHTPDQCPALDDDGDGVVNGKDRCPLQAGIPAEQGCPPSLAQVNVETGKIDIQEKVFFDTDKSTIQERSFKLLDDVAALLVANPKVGPIVVEGHTDSTGPAELNRELSLERAKAVKAYLVEKGVAAERLEPKGFGPDRPAQPNTTEEGREANRRVEFVIAK